jgi:hypothetical protein
MPVTIHPAPLIIIACSAAGKIVRQGSASLVRRLAFAAVTTAAESKPSS